MRDPQASTQVAIALAITLGTMVIGVVGILQRRKVAVTDATAPVLPRWALITLLTVGGVVFVLLILGLVFAFTL